MDETFRDEGGRKVAGPQLLVHAPERRHTMAILVAAAAALVLFWGGMLIGHTTSQRSIAEQVADRAPCTVQVLATAGEDAELDAVTENARGASSSVGAELEVLRRPDYLVLVATLCGADRMEGA